MKDAKTHTQGCSSSTEEEKEEEEEEDNSMATNTYWNQPVTSSPLGPNIPFSILSQTPLVYILPLMLEGKLDVLHSTSYPCA
jgi:hypothetical protein